MAIQPVTEANITIQKPQEQPQAVAKVQHGDPPQAPNDGQQQEAQFWFWSSVLRFEHVLASTTDVVFIYVFCIMSPGISFYSVVGFKA